MRSLELHAVARPKPGSRSFQLEALKWVSPDVSVLGAPDSPQSLSTFWAFVVICGCEHAQPSPATGSGKHPHFPRSRRRMSASRITVFHWQGFICPAALGAKGVLSWTRSLPSTAH